MRVLFLCISYHSIVCLKPAVSRLPPRRRLNVSRLLRMRTRPRSIDLCPLVGYVGAPTVRSVNFSNLAIPSEHHVK